MIIQYKGRDRIDHKQSSNLCCNMGQYVGDCLQERKGDVVHSR